MKPREMSRCQERKRKEEEEAKKRCDTGIELVQKESPWSLGAFHLLTYDCGCPTPQKVAELSWSSRKETAFWRATAPSPVPRLLVGIRPPSTEPAHAHDTRTGRAEPQQRAEARFGGRGGGGGPKRPSNFCTAQKITNINSRSP